MFINKTFLQDALQNYSKDTGLRVIQFLVTNATNKGDNYMSDMYRVTVNYLRNGVNENKSIVIKVAPFEEGARRGMVITLSFSHINSN